MPLLTTGTGTFITAAPPSSGFVFINGASAANTSASSGATTSAMDTSAANLIVIGLGWLSSGTPTLSDSNSNTWTGLTTSIGSTFSNRIYYCVNPVVGAGHTFTVTGTAVYSSLNVQVFSGSHATPFDAETGGTGIGSTASAGTGVTPSQGAEVVIACTSADLGNISSINGGFTSVNPIAFSSGQHFILGMAYLIQTTATAADPDWTLSGSANWAARIACFKKA